jgi:hypothetical protein
MQRARHAENQQSHALAQHHARLNIPPVGGIIPETQEKKKEVKAPAAAESKVPDKITAVETQSPSPAPVSESPVLQRSDEVEQPQPSPPRTPVLPAPLVEDVDTRGVPGALEVEELERIAYTSDPESSPEPEEAAVRREVSTSHACRRR